MTMICAMGLALAVQAAFVPANESRVREIAAMLPEKPTMVDPGSALLSMAKSAGLVGRIEELAKKEVPAFPDKLYNEYWLTGNRTHFEEWQMKFLAGLGALAVGEAKEGRGRLVPAIAARLEAICGWPSWILPAHDWQKANYEGRGNFVDLRSSGLARLLARIIWALGDKLPAATVAHVRKEIDRRVFTPYLKSPKELWWFQGHNNWNAVCHSGCVIAALELIEDRTVRARFVEAAERGSRPYLEYGFEPDGYCSEGMGYWNYGFGHFLELALAVRSATGGKVDLLAHPQALKAMRYPFAYRLNRKVSPNFADGNGAANALVIATGLKAWPGLKAELDAEPPLSSAFPDGQVWVMRLPSAAGGKFALALKGGHNDEHHNHNDLGSYCMMIGGELVAGDVGREIYTARTFGPNRYDSKVINSYGHPVPRVGERLQGTGRKFAAKVVRTEFADARDTVVLDLRGGYDCPALAVLERTFTFDRKTRTATVADRVRFTEPTAFESPVLTVAPDKLKGHLSIAATGGDWEKAEEDIPNPGLPTARRIAVRFKKPVVEATVSFAFRE